MQVFADRNAAAAGIERRAKLFRGLADPSRLAILGVLCEGPLVVHEIVKRTGLSQPNVSNHLRISSPRITALLNDVDALLDVVAEGVEACDNYCGE